MDSIIVTLTRRRGIFQDLVEKGWSILRPLPIREMITTISVKRRMNPLSLSGCGRGRMDRNIAKMAMPAMTKIIE
jgi:hypothetical protein